MLSAGSGESGVRSWGMSLWKASKRRVIAEWGLRTRESRLWGCERCARQREWILTSARDDARGAGWVSTSSGTAQG